VIVPLPEPYSFDLSLERYRTFGPDPAALWHEGGLHRVFRGVEVRIEAAPGGVRIEPGRDDLADEVRRFLGIAFDLEAFEAFAAQEPVLAQIVPRLGGLRPPVVGDPFEALVGSITAQQVSLGAALAIRTRLIKRFGKKALRAFGFPKREVLAGASAEELRALGFSTGKAEYVIGLARSDLDLDALAALPDEEVKARLTALPGIGEWTADWFLARHLARPNAWPAGDLGLRKAVGRFVLPGRDPSVEETRTIGERFALHRNLAAHYLLTGMRVLVEPLT
jgi:3-methyladenine DNA glycosylase/8-oxoguanine DNA glycosylase